MERATKDDLTKSQKDVWDGQFKNCMEEIKVLQFNYISHNGLLKQKKEWQDQVIQVGLEETRGAVEES